MFKDASKISLNSLRVKGIILFVFLVTATWGGIAWWQENHSYLITENSAFHTTLVARPRMHPGLSSISVDLSVPPQTSGMLLFRLQRHSLGTTCNSYSWDGVTGSYPSKDISLIDLSKMVREDSAIRAWDVDMARPGLLRLKVWRDEGKRWRVVAQSQIVAAGLGPNHFILDSPLPVRKGDYVGLYLSAGVLKLSSPNWFGTLGSLNLQNPINLLLSANLGLSYAFTGDIISSFKDESKKALSPGYSYKVYFKPEPVKSTVGLVNRTIWPGDSLPLNIADLNKDSLHANGNYSYKALSTSNDPPGQVTATLALRPGRGNYRFELPQHPFALDEQVELFIESLGGVKAFLYPSVLGYLRGYQFIGMEYGIQSSFPEAQVVSGTYRWPIIDILIILMVCCGIWVLLKQRNSRWDLVAATLPVFAAMIVWKQWCLTAPLISLLPAIVVMLTLPGFVLLELIFPKLAGRLDSLERPPLLFGFSMGFWTLIAALAYRLQWPSDLIVIGVWLFDLAGLVGVFFFRPSHVTLSSTSDEQPQSTLIRKWYLVTLILMMAIVASTMAYCSQFQMTDYDSMFHLAGYRNVAENSRVINGDNILGPGFPSLPQYTASPWYLVGGLAARQAQVEVTWLLVILTTLLTVLVFLCFYSILITLLFYQRLAIIGILIGSSLWICTFAVNWKMFWSFYLTFLPFPYSITQLILLPMSLLYGLRYIISQDWEKWIATAILATATMGLHLEYIIHVPFVLCLMLLASMIIPNTGRNRLQTLALIEMIGLLAAIVCYLWITAPMRGPVESITEAEALKMWKGVWRASGNIYAANLREYFLADGWKILLSLAVIIQFMVSQIKSGRENCPTGRSVGFRPALPTEPPIQRLAVATIVIVLAPWLIVFNPIIIPLMVKLMHSTIPFYRMMGSTGAFSQAVEFGALGCVVLSLLHYVPIRLSVFKEVTLLVIIGLFIAAPLSLPSAREAVIGALGNYGWYPSLLDLPNDSLYRGLSQLKPGAVVVRADQAIRIAGLSPLHPIFVSGDRIGDYRLSQEREAATHKILNFTVSPAEMCLLLNKYHVKYVIISIGSPHLPQFRSHPEIFSEGFQSEADVVFTVKL